MTKLRNTAVTTISMTIDVVRMVLSNARSITGTVSRRLAAARPREAMTPSEAASLGVAMPA